MRRRLFARRMRKCGRRREAAIASDTPGEPTLRTLLREGTRAAHDRLDEAMNACDLRTGEGYGRFLTIQYQARSGIDAWFTARQDTALAAPPPSTQLLACDLRSLGWNDHPPVPAFAAPAECDARAVAWVLSGSSLGNRSILSGLRGRDLPTSFLEDQGLFSYWRDLLPHLSAAAPDPSVSLASAQAVFAHFLAIAGDSIQRKAA